MCLSCDFSINPVELSLGHSYDMLPLFCWELFVFNLKSLFSPKLVFPGSHKAGLWSLHGLPDLGLLLLPSVPDLQVFHIEF